MMPELDGSRPSDPSQGPDWGTSQTAEGCRPPLAEAHLGGAQERHDTLPLGVRSNLQQ
jgi:hypothetical protein